MELEDDNLTLILAISIPLAIVLILFAVFVALLVRRRSTSSSATVESSEMRSSVGSTLSISPESLVPMVAIATISTSELSDVEIYGLLGEGQVRFNVTTIF